MSERRKSKLSIINNIMKPISHTRPRHSHGAPEEPTKISIPPPLTFPKIPQLERLGRGNSECSTKDIRQNLRLNNSRCAFCDESLSIKLDGELDLQLSCTHACHKYCYLTMMDKNDLEGLPFCIYCDKKTQCVDVTIHTGLKHQKLAEPPLPDYRGWRCSPHGSMGSKTYDSLVKSPIGTGESQLMSPIYNENLYQEILKPRIQVTSYHANYVSDGEYDLDCLINVKPPPISECASDTPEDNVVKSSIIQDIKIKLALHVTNWKDSMLPLSELGDLWMFDFLDISSNGTDWDNFCFYFFDNAILLIDYTGTHLIGQILIHKDISSINRIESGISFNLSNEALPELYIRHTCSLIISKWEYYLIQAVRKIPVGSIPLLHITTNAWELVEEANRSSEGLEFCSLIERNIDIPSSLLTRIMPPAEKISLNVNVSISLINCTEISNNEYKENIITLLQKLRSKLRPIDKLGLIFLGVDGYGKPSKSGTFIGCVSPTWDGWDNVINDIRIFANKDDRLLPIFDNGFEEMLISLNKYKQLLPYIPSGPKNNNRLIILNSNNYDILEPLNYLISKTKEQINCLIENESLTIDIVRIGQMYSIEVQEVYNLISKPIQNNDTIAISLGSKLLRFDTFLEFFESLDFIMECKFQSGYMPYVTIDFKKAIGTECIISFSEIEINGEMASLPSNLTSLKIIVKNNFPLTQRNIMMKFKLNFPDALYNLENIIEYSIINYQARWVENNDGPKRLKTRISKTGSPHILFSDGTDISRSPLDQIDGDSYFVDIPLLPPLSSFKDQGFARRKTELAIIKSLRTAEYSSVDETENILSHLISLVFGIIRGLDGVSDKPYTPVESRCNSGRWKSFMLHFEMFNHNQRYIQCLVDELESINNLFRNDSRSALVRCQDFANWIA